MFSKHTFGLGLTARASLDQVGSRGAESRKESRGDRGERGERCGSVMRRPEPQER
jgi:hypothetical protein